jgi:hypothetical protein
MYSYSALGSDATVALSEYSLTISSRFPALSSLNTSLSPLSPPPSPPVLNSKRMGKRKQSSYIGILNGKIK